MRTLPKQGDFVALWMVWNTGVADLQIRGQCMFRNFDQGSEYVLKQYQLHIHYQETTRTDIMAEKMGILLFWILILVILIFFQKHLQFSLHLNQYSLFNFQVSGPKLKGNLRSWVKQPLLLTFTAICGSTVNGCGGEGKGLFYAGVDAPAKFSIFLPPPHGMLLFPTLASRWCNASPPSQPPMPKQHANGQVLLADRGVRMAGSSVATSACWLLAAWAWAQLVWSQE